jgi:hypothetical protein
LPAGIAGSNLAGSIDVCVAGCTGISDMSTQDIKIHDGQKNGMKGREKSMDKKKKKIPLEARFSAPLQD